ncbi:lysozyme [Pseudomonas sp. Au-Pse12]|uniref:lysozyme n=1 Tax=Pseudomonas sp. Au-Pse12 TaxID=2906459 RepID=UPI001E64CF8B|nr:lysozyme [Pseudomonas sp. Au-Pse12]MCE4058441.1 lysozyme [Pseudomonas sp. Au-Pse12]
MKLPRGLVLPLAAGFMPVLLALVMFFEGCRLTAYQDGAGVWTICYGHTLGVKRGDVATVGQCMAWLQQDLQASISAVDKRLKPDVGWLCRVANVDWVFQFGETRYRRSTLLARFNAGDRYGAPDEFLRWVYVDGKDCRLAASNCGGVVTRAQVRRELCLAAP